MDDAQHHEELRRVADILEAWADAIRADTPAAVDAERAERNATMADVLGTAVAALRVRGNDALLAAIRSANAISAEGVPAGYDLAQVYTDGSEVVVCGMPPADGTHDCTRMGCGPSAHVIFRIGAAGTNSRE